MIKKNKKGLKIVYCKYLLIYRMDQNYKNSVFLDIKPEPKQFQFDHVLDETKSQEDLFNIVGKPLVNFCLEGKTYLKY